MSDLYRPKQPGDILRLHVPVGDSEPSTYVLLSASDTRYLVLLGENEERQFDTSKQNTDYSVIRW